LVQVDDKDIPLCWIVDYKVWLYQQKRKQKKVKKSVKPKEIRFRSKIAEHDVQNKVRQLNTFLNEGRPVQVTILFPRWEDVSVKGLIGKEMMENILTRVEGTYHAGSPKTTASSMSQYLTPKKKNEKEKTTTTTENPKNVMEKPKYVPNITNNETVNNETKNIAKEELKDTTNNDKNITEK
jgi:translation initiation factor IF-3